jgi:hypothetical protein
VLDIGRRSRIVPAPMRRAVILRDGGCAFPGCGRPPRWCQAHHIWHWSTDGPTALDWGVAKILDSSSRLRGSVHAREAPEVQSAVQG